MEAEGPKEPNDVVRIPGAVRAMESASEEAIGVVNGLFDIKSIAGDKFSLVPKDFHPTQLKKCVYRKDHLATILEKLKILVQEENFNVPGIYLQGPAGVGKSVLVYTITQLAKFHYHWLTVYVPNCREWTKSDIAGMGFFLDRVKEAFSIEEMKEKYSEVWKLLDNVEIEGFENWTLAGEIDADLRSKKQQDKYNTFETYIRVIELLKSGNKDAPILLVFDEVNAICGEGDGQFLKSEPWNITDFGVPSLRHGALLVSGTTDSDFVLSIPAGYDRKCVYSVTEFEPEETELLLNTELGAPLKRIREFEACLWHEIDDACCNMPRDLMGFSTRLRHLSSRIDNLPPKDLLEKRSSHDTDEGPARKRLKLDISAAIQEKKKENQAYHLRLFQHVITRDQQKYTNIFEENLFEWCEKYFLENELDYNLEILRAPNFIISSTGMRPTTVDASRAYFEWFLEKCKGRTLSSVAHNLATICNEHANGGERGNAFERFLSSRLTLCGNSDGFALEYRLLAENHKYSVPFRVRNRLFAKADSPPNDFRNYPQDTLLTHTAKDGGETRVDMIYYGTDDVIYIEATVGNYRSTKLPSGRSAEDRVEKILLSVKKWLGGDVYDVKINERSSGLSISYTKSYPSRNNSGRRSLPRVHYMVVTTCPASLQPALKRGEEYKWIKVCFLEDLITMGIIPQDKYKSILNAQAENARSGTLLDWLGTAAKLLFSKS